MNIDAYVVDTVCGTISAHGMIKKGDRVLAAVSGGADSVCMLHILRRLSEELGFTLFCAHLNHGLRGAAADSDEKYVEKLCAGLGVNLYTRRADVAGRAVRDKLTVEEAGRAERYEFFDELRKKHKITLTATAHNKNDNAETVLMRIMRGTGTDGLSAVQYKRDDGVIRPLLDVSRKEIEGYCEANGLEYCTDATNSDNLYTRNKIRNELIPYIEREFGCDMINSLAKLAENAGGDARFINGYAERVYKRLSSPLPSGKPNVLHIESLCVLERPIAVRVVKIAAGRAKPGLRLEKKHIDDILALCGRDTGAAVDLPRGLRAEVRYGWIEFFEQGTEVERIRDEGGGFLREVSVGSVYYIEEIDKNIGLRIEGKGYSLKINESGADMDKLENEKLFIRGRRKGDRIVFFPDGRTKKIKNVFIDAKIPKADREKIPLLCTKDEVVAIIGGRVGEKYKVNKDTERILVIEYGADRQN